MGYRSQVRSLVYGEPTKVDAFLVKTKLLDNTAMEEFKDHITVEIVKLSQDEEIKCVELNGDSWKWYPDYKDVKAWHKFLDDAEEFGLATEFARVGEESDDIEVMQNDGAGDDGYECVYALSTYTSINSDFGD